MPKSLQFWIASGIALGSLAITRPVPAQPVPDATLPVNSVVTTQGNTSTITGGTRAGRNLFHSFREFSVSTGSTAYFNNALDIHNIISRVTGGSVSNIDGLIKANGEANLFLINPQGIMFGPHASLNIGGSFLASTAKSLKFADGTEFSATAPQTTPLLTISVPLGLQFGANPGGIGMQGDGQGLRSTSELIDTTAGLHVASNQTLALVGGDVALTGGTLKTAGGRIELGSVAGPSFVSLTPIDKGWALGYEGVQNFGEIKLSGQTAVDASGNGGGDIQVQGSQVTLTDGSTIEASTLGTGQGGNLVFNAQDSVQLIGTSADGQIPSSLFANAYKTATGVAGNLTIKTGKLIVSDGAQVAASTLGQGQGGKLSVTASDSVELSGTVPGSQFPTGLFTQTSGAGTAGDLIVNTGKLIVSDGAQVDTNTVGQGRGGKLTVTASDSVELSGRDPSGQYSSGLFTQAQTEGAGAAGDLTIATGNLLVQNGARVSAGTSGQGNGGNIQVNANSVNFFGVSPNGRSSGLFTGTTGAGQAGTINVNSSTFRLADGAVVDARTTGKGNITTNSNAFRGGNININANTLDVTNGGQLRTTTSGTGLAGDINLKVLNNATLQGQGSGILANTAAGSTGNGGSIVIDPKQLTIANGAQVAVGSMGHGEAGNIFLQARAITLDRGLVSATSASANGGNVSVQAPESLLMRHGSQISATAGTAFGGGNGGNISIDNTALVIAFPTEDSNISTNAFKGNGGQVKINAAGIFGIQPQPADTSLSAITASSTGGGIKGVVNINTLDVDPSRGLVTLPVILADSSKQIAQGCAAGNGTTGSRFVVTGRGGLPSNPSEPLSSEVVWSDTRFVAATGKPQHSQKVSAPQPSASAEVTIVPATGWVFNGKGDVTLTAAVPSDRIQVPWLTPASCQTR